MTEGDMAVSPVAARPEARMLGPRVNGTDGGARLGEQLLKQRISELHAASASMLSQVDTLANMAHQIASRLRAGAKVMLAGNGGSACQAQHFAAELLGRLSPFRDRDGLAAYVLGSDLPTMTAIANDYGYENVFCRQLQGIARAGDALIMFSTSGQSENLLRAALLARSLEVFTAALVGSDRSALSYCDAVVTVHAEDPGTIQECHLLMIHTLTYLIEDEYGYRDPGGKGT
jgi:phosphoheptose isomerase